MKTFVKTVALAFLFVVQLAHPVAAQSLSERARIAIARRLAQSTVSVLAGPSTGTGFVVQNGAERVVVTNIHVIEPNGMHFPIQVRWAAGSTANATLVELDREHDLAVLRVAGQLTARPLALTDSDTVQVGQTVLAFGSPFGLDGSMTEGIVSARRDVPGLVRGHELIQTDAAINPGNSGGPLVDRRGRVVGVNTAIYSRTGGNHGVGFAVPSNFVVALLAQIRQNASATTAATHDAAGAPVSAFLGVIGEDFSQGTTQGVRVQRVVPGSPAEAAGILGSDRPAPPLVARSGVPWIGHIITAIDGHPIHTAQELQVAVGQHHAGDQIRISVTLGATPTGQSLSGDTVATLAAPH